MASFTSVKKFYSTGTWLTCLRLIKLQTLRESSKFKFLGLFETNLEFSMEVQPLYKNQFQASQGSRDSQDLPIL
jgi:hypothetical protein